RIPGRHRGPDLSAVRAHDRRVGAPVGVQRADAESSAECADSEAEATGARTARARVQRIQPGVHADDHRVRLRRQGTDPAVGLGAAGGFELMLQDRTDGDLTRFADVIQSFVETARQRPEIASINTGLRTTVPQFRVDLDTDKALTLGVPVTDVYSALQTFLG